MSLGHVQRIALHIEANTRIGLSIRRTQYPAVYQGTGTRAVTEIHSPSPSKWATKYKSAGGRVIFTAVLDLNTKTLEYRTIDPDTAPADETEGRQYMHQGAPLDDTKRAAETKDRNVFNREIVELLTTALKTDNQRSVSGLPRHVDGSYIYVTRKDRTCRMLVPDFLYLWDAIPSTKRAELSLFYTANIDLDDVNTAVATECTIRSLRAINPLAVVIPTGGGRPRQALAGPVAALPR